MSGFSIDWLALREPADRQARDPVLALHALALLADRAQPTLIFDLAAGTGATLRALTALGECGARWRLLDQDEILLEEAHRRHAASGKMETQVLDLRCLERVSFQDADLVTASALLDLVSPGFVTALTTHLRTYRLPFYAALSYDGLMSWFPVHPCDEAVLEAFNLNQRTDKGFGAALGPTATRFAQQALTASGFRVMVRPSPWQLTAAEGALVVELVNGIERALQNYLPEATLADWARFRRAHAASGTCLVGHQDLLALPD